MKRGAYQPAASKYVLPAPYLAGVVYDDLSGLDAHGGVGLAAGYANPTLAQIHLPKGQAKNRFALAHELAHVFDEQVLSDGHRAVLQRKLKLPKGPWRDESSEQMYSPDEWFADYYAAAATNLDPRREIVSSYATNITPRRLKRFRRIMTRIARREGLPALDLSAYR